MPGPGLVAYLFSDNLSVLLNHGDGTFAAAVNYGAGGEPTGNLDTAHGDDVMRSLTSLNDRGATIVMVTHSPTYAGHAKRLINLLDGNIVDGAARPEALA